MKGNENMVKVLLVSGISGNGGTQTWTREYLKSYDSDRFKLVHVNIQGGNRHVKGWCICTGFV